MIAERYSLYRRLNSCAAIASALLAFAAMLAGCGGGDGGSQQVGTPSSPATAHGARILSVAPVIQQTEVWCWAATAEMVFRHYGLPALNGNFQCGIVAVYFGGICMTDCRFCVSPIGTMSQLQNLINDYGVVVGQFTPSRRLSSRISFRALSIDEIVGEIEAGRIVAAGVSPTGYSYPNISQHVVAIIGYDTTGASPRLIVNDPFPYSAFPLQADPYIAVGAIRLRPGQYSITWNNFVNQLKWANTIDKIQ